jgi:hypothetical protein
MASQPKEKPMPRSDFETNIAKVRDLWNRRPDLKGQVRETSRLLGGDPSPSTVSRVAAFILQSDPTNPFTQEPQPMPPTTTAPPAPIFKSPVQRAEQAAEAVAHGQGGDVNAAVTMLVQALASMQRQSIDADGVRAIVKPMIDAIDQPKVLQFIVPNRPESQHIDNAHTLLPKAVTLAQVLGLCWLCGPAGSGKTTIAEQVAKAMSLPFGSLSCTAGMSEGHLTGRPTIQGGYIPARFVELYETGGVFLFDEFDAADPNTALVVNSALANGYLSVPYRTEKQRADRHKDFVCIIATNTWGNGADPQYLGRSGLDLATRDRFAAAKILVGYDQSLEKRILANDKLHTQLMVIRKNIDTHKLRRILSTRAIAQMSALIRSGITAGDALDTYLTDWTDNEKAKGLENVRI